MNCRDIQEQLTAYVLGDLPSGLAGEVRCHLETCADCRSAEQGLRFDLTVVQEAFARRRAQTPRLAPSRRAAILTARRQKPAVTRIPLRRIVEWAAAAMILVMLAGLLMPAGQMARERAYRVPKGSGSPAKFSDFEFSPDPAGEVLGEAINGERGDSDGDETDNLEAEELGSPKPIESAQPAFGGEEREKMAEVLSGAGDVRRRERPVASRRLDDVGAADINLTGAKPGVMKMEKQVKKKRVDVSYDTGAAPTLLSETPTIVMASERVDAPGAIGYIAGIPDGSGKDSDDNGIANTAEFGPGGVGSGGRARREERFEYKEANADIRPAGRSERKKEEGGGDTLKHDDGKATSPDRTTSYFAEDGRHGGRPSDGTVSLPNDVPEIAALPNGGKLSPPGVTTPAPKPDPSWSVNGWKTLAGKAGAGIPVAKAPESSSQVRAPEGNLTLAAGLVTVSGVPATPPPAPPAAEKVNGLYARRVAADRSSVAKGEKANEKEAQEKGPERPRLMFSEDESAVAPEPIYPPQVYNPIIDTKSNPFSTFGIDVDTASFTLARRYLLGGRLPPAGAIRVEEFVNAFEYAYKPPETAAFAVYCDRTRSPFRPGLEILRIGVRGKVLGRDRQRPLALTFVVDTSGSMNTPDRLELAQKAMTLLLDRLTETDTMAIVAFGSESRLVLDHTSAARRQEIRAAIAGLQTSGSTHLEGGIRLGYDIAARRFRTAAANRVMIFSDGVANLGAATSDEILKQVEASRKQGIYCSVFGLGTGAYNDAMLQALADKGDGVYRFLDSVAEARRVLVEEFAATLHVIAKDMKIQVEFCPDRVKAYRQIGYEKRQLTKEQFRDDAVDAGEVGSGQSSTALYELETAGALDEPLGTVRLRWKDPDTGLVTETAHPIRGSDKPAAFESASPRFRLAVGAAELADWLRDNPLSAETEGADILKVLRSVGTELSLDPQVRDVVRMASQAARMKKR